MPELDGFDTTRTIRNEPAYSAYAKIPIIAMTANAFAGDEERCLAAGMDGYMAKPIEPKALYQLISQFISQQRPVS